MNDTLADQLRPHLSVLFAAGGDEEADRIERTVASGQLQQEINGYRLFTHNVVPAKAHAATAIVDILERFRP